MPNATLDVILTHEHTDFDALASLLAASLLYPQATPVLPRQMNRNVREFVSLYHSHLPFIQPSHLPRRRIAKVVLVDTRALNLPRGLAPDAELLVIDHHVEVSDTGSDGKPAADGVRSPQRDQPARRQVWSEPVGANTTLLVERLMESGAQLRPLHATLFALGIHEDTGSLTYGGTTWRDARALAWLLEPERGVNLDVLNQFLHHPLGEGQRRLLESLIADSEVVEVEGYTIVVAQGEAAGQTDEISTVAARLRDFHEQDAVFLVIQLDEMVQIVARSVTDEVDVGAVARALGGGGHTRAAAAPVRGLSTAQLRDQIVNLVGAQVRSRASVRHIMSSGWPHTLAPDMAVNDAAELMRRYGHEGFPVVAARTDSATGVSTAADSATGESALLGVLTRNEADRAIAHGLGAEPVRRFMRSGSVSVRPEDSLPTLRRTMIESGWGQIPVVDENNRIIGIVTRTDLIKTWDDPRAAEHRSGAVEQRLASALAPLQHHLLRLLGEQAAALGFTIFVVGGFVRDLLLNQAAGRVQSFDVDIVLEGDGIHFANHLQRRYGGRVVQHRQFNTAKWILDDAESPINADLLLAPLPAAARADLPRHLDFISSRTEFYTAPSVLPTVENSSIKLDLHRRDFTINTLALCLNPDRWGQLLDFWGGVNDLHAGIVRVLHSLSFVDDPTRILRAVRYEQRFGFQIDPRTLELIADALDLLDRVTPARIRHEVERILQEAEPERMMVRLDALGVLAQIDAGLQAGAWVEQSFARMRRALIEPSAPADEPATDEHGLSEGLRADLRSEPLERLYWVALLYPSPEANDARVTARLGLRRATQILMADVRLMQTARPQLLADALRPSQAVALLDEIAPAAAALVVLLEDDARLAAILDAYRTRWSAIKAELTGDDLRAMGLPPSPRYRALLEGLRAARLDGQIATRAEEEQLLQQWLAG